MYLNAKFVYFTVPSNKVHKQHGRLLITDQLFTDSAQWSAQLSGFNRP